MTTTRWTKRRIGGSVAIALAVATGSVVGVPGIARAATFTVTNTADSGPGSLRQAVQAANAAAGADTIVFALPNPSTISLTTDVRITDDLRIEGPGRSALTLTNPTSRVLDVDAGSLYVESLTIADAGANAIVFTSPADSVQLDDMTISDSANHALNVMSASSVTVTNSELTNSRPLGFSGDGIQARNVTGNVFIEDVIASGNEDGFEIADVGGVVTLRRVTSASSLDEGADVQRVGGVVIESSTFDFDNDQVDLDFVSGTVLITDSTFSGAAIDDGLEISNVAGGAVVSGSTVSGSAQAGVWIGGDTTPTSVLVVNSTFSGNANSGIVVASGGTAAVYHSTVTSNGLRGITLVGGTVDAGHTILSGNADGDVSVASGTATVRYSLVPSGSAYGGSSGNVVASDPQLGPLTFNGGPTRTHLPQPGSPAINAGNPALPSPPPLDQRGLPRVVGTIDIGSVEVASTPQPPNRGSVSLLPATINLEESVGTVPFTVTRSGGTSGEVSVLVKTQNLTGAAPGDFVAVSQVVTFPDGVGGSKTVPVTIVDDTRVETDETFKIALSDPTGGLAIGSGNSIVTIKDNDEPLPPDPELDAAGRFVPLPPSRLFDTRSAEAAPGPKGKIGAGQTIDVQIWGQSGVPTNATAVVMNVTMTQSEDVGFVTAWATGSPRPASSNLNYRLPNQTRPNLVTVPIGAGGKVSMYASSPTHLLADVSGYYVDVDEAVAAGRLVSVSPSRVFDTRPAEIAPGPKGLLAEDQTIEVTVSGAGGLPSTGVAAVVMNVTAAGVASDGFVTAYPSDVPRPTASVLNVKAGGPAVANLVILPVGPDGKIRFFSTASTHLIGDVMGFFTDASAPKTTDGLFVPVAPSRVFDSRPTAPEPGPKGVVAAKTSVDFVSAGVAAIPADAAAVFLNITAVKSDAAGYVTGWSTGLTQPLASLLNLGADDTRPNATILAPGAGGKISLFTFSSAHLLADTFGYYLG